MEMVVGAPGQATKIHQQEREAEGQGRLGSGPKGLNPSFPVINRQETESKSALMSLTFFFLLGNHSTYLTGLRIPNDSVWMGPATQ